jgi:pimeloyl-ACP methyl ester carboxylesterase
MVYREDSIAVRGRQVRLWRGGQGHPLVYCHDVWSQTWLPLHDRLAAAYEVVFPMHPGFEGADDLDDIDCIEDLVFHYLDLIEVLGIDQPILLGLRVPGAPAADLFLLNAAQMRTAMFADPTAVVAQALVPDTPPQEAMLPLLKARRAYARFAWQFPDNPKLGSYLYRIKCPTLVVWGERDGVVPLRHAQVYRTEIAAAKLVGLPECGHLPHVEQPEALAAAVLTFLQPAEAHA